MKNRILFFILAIVVISSSCQRGEHFISDKTYRQKVEDQFEKRRTEAAHRSVQLFSVFDTKVSCTEREALKFLYAYMPLSDLADYDGEFYLKNVRASLAARDTFSWGRSVPEIIFRHFVLPIRVNNENLDSSRWVFFMELKDRIKRMKMKEAVLEVNHWCHEKVSYRGTDGRTSSPLATVKTAYGRCGEESTFTVAALRAVGIPARQCYTPRWAHSDDNHAWVEVWVDSTWHYIGACEPEADLDVAWFTAPAKRAMLVNTNVFGDYEGPEDVLVKDPLFTRINILSNYAPTKRIVAAVYNDLNQPVDSASVEFLLYNYAEFYPLHKIPTDKAGLASLQTGLGDLVIWASKNGRFGYQKVTVKDQDTVKITLSLVQGTEFSDSFDLIPPPEQEIVVKMSDSMKSENAKRLSFEDKIRGGYEITFIDSAKAFRLAATLKLNPDSLWKFLRKSRGNWREIIDFVSTTPKEQATWIYKLLGAVSEKDLRDITPEVLTDNILSTKWIAPEGLNKELYIQYVLSPRVDNEWLRPYKGFLQSRFSTSFIDSAHRNPVFIADWIKNNIRIDRVSNYSRAPLTPIGSFELRTTDPHSRDILFVALCRSFGIPSRLEPGTRVPQFYAKKVWTDVFFDSPIADTPNKSILTLVAKDKRERRPEYYIHFTVEKFSDGFFRSLDYETDERLQTFPCSLELDPGYYMLVTGNRVAISKSSGERVSGGVLVSMKAFNIEPERKPEMEIILRKDQTPFPILGKIDPQEFIRSLSPDILLQFRKNKGVVVALLEPDKEPTKHFVAEFKLKSGDFSRWQGNTLFLFNSDKDQSGFLSANQRELPKEIRYSSDGGSIITLISNSLDRSLGTRLPMIVYINPKGDVLYLSEGYRIGIGDDLLQVIKK